MRARGYEWAGKRKICSRYIDALRFKCCRCLLSLLVLTRNYDFLGSQSAHDGAEEKNKSNHNGGIKVHRKFAVIAQMDRSSERAFAEIIVFARRD